MPRSVCLALHWVNPNLKNKNLIKIYSKSLKPTGEKFEHIFFTFILHRSGLNPQNIMFRIFQNISDWLLLYIKFAGIKTSKIFFCVYGYCNLQNFSLTQTFKDTINPLTRVMENKQNIKIYLFSTNKSNLYILGKPINFCI